jgi:hypothetical protein
MAVEWYSPNNPNTAAALWYWVNTKHFPASFSIRNLAAPGYTMSRKTNKKLKRDDV